MSRRRNLLPRPDLGTRTAGACRLRGAEPLCPQHAELSGSCAHNTQEVTQFLHQCQNVSTSK